MSWLGLCVLPATALLACEASAQQYKIFPPAEYDHYYEGDLTIKMVATVEELRAICQLDQPQLLACTLRNQHSCVIVLVNDEVMRKRNWTTGMLLRHEMGHCNGWPADHAGERSVTWPTTHWAHPDARVRLPTPRAKPDATTAIKGDRLR
jgi:hypothetical protein